MSEGAVLAPWVALASTLLLAALAVALLRARALFVMCAVLASASAIGAATLFMAGIGDGAMALGAFGVGLAPVWLLAAVLLSARAAKPGRRGVSILAIVAAMSGAIAAILIAPELSVTRLVVSPGEAQTFWLAGLVFVAAIGAAAVTGYGERGAFDLRAGDDR